MLSRQVSVAPEPAREHDIDDGLMDIDDDFQNPEAPDPDDADEEPAPEDDEVEEILPGLKVKSVKKAKRYESSVSRFLPCACTFVCLLLEQDVPLRAWKNVRHEFLDDTMFVEGRSAWFTACASCGTPMPRSGANHAFLNVTRITHCITSRYVFFTVCLLAYIYRAVE